MPSPATSQVKPDPVTGRYEDAAHRLSDIVNTHLAAEGQAAWGRFVAARLSDGGTDGNLYDSKADAVRFQLHEQQCAYVMVTPDGMSPHVAAIMLRFFRDCYDNGLNPADPDFTSGRMFGL